jgi:hypothetical protein
MALIGSECGWTGGGGAAAAVVPDDAAEAAGGAGIDADVGDVEGARAAAPSSGDDEDPPLPPPENQRPNMAGCERWWRGSGRAGEEER